MSEPASEYVVPSSTVIVRVQPSSVSSEMSLPEIAVISIPPKPKRNPRCSLKLSFATVKKNCATWTMSCGNSRKNA